MIQATSKTTRGSSPSSGKLGRRGTATNGMTFKRTFSRDGVHPFDEIEWELRSPEITEESGNVIFKQ